LDEHVSGLLEEALQCCQTGDFVQAEQLCREALAVDEDTPDAWNTLAQLFYQQARFIEARDAAGRATALRPEIPPYWLTRGNIELARSETPLAQASFERAVELDPTFAEAHYRLGTAFLLDKRPREAIGAFRSALRYAANVPDIHYQLAQALNVEGRWEEAMRAYQDAFTRDPAGQLDRRPCLDFMRHLHWNALPQFWDGEITRFFRRNDVDKARYVSVGLRALQARDVFRSALAAPRHASAALDDIMRNEFLCLLLREAVIPRPDFEMMLTGLRAQLLFKADLRAQAPLEFLCALAQQCVNNEFVYRETDAERADADGLVTDLEARLQPGQAVPEPLLRSALVLAMYRPLHALTNVDVLLAEAAEAGPLQQLLRRSVLDVRNERQLRGQIAALGTRDEVPGAEQSQDETSPHPRWFSVDRAPLLSFAQWLERELPVLGEVSDAAERPRILVAGCGTGQNAISLADSIAGAQVVAVDASLANLAYARRMASELGIANVEFRRGDAGCPGEPARAYDAIFCERALHSAPDPQAALRSLAALLRPGGWLKLALHSERARASVNEGRRLVRERRLDATAPAIRNFRQHIFSLGKRSSLTPLTWFHEFYSLGTCRDLLFCEREHQYRLPQIAALVSNSGLALVGLSGVPVPALAAYRRNFPADAAAADFENWDAFEAGHPETFMGMFHVWARVTEQAASSRESLKD
jgi:SAM-dependent methyltransferase/Flp pilus assembly protein TadD